MNTFSVFRVISARIPGGREQAKELIEDLLDSIKDRPENVADMPPYFLGSIVLIKGEGEPAADVVDGQQRLTTLTILLAALRATIASVEGQGITGLIYQKGDLILTTDDHFRLRLRERDREFFQDNVQRSEGFTALMSLKELPDAQLRIQENAGLFVERLNKLGEEARIRLAQFLVTRCYLVVVSTPDLESAYRIFSVMNSRGLDLSATDILKASIIGRLPEKERDKYTDRWESIEEDLGRDAFQDVFGHIRTIYRKAKPQGTLLKEFEDHVGSAHPPRELIDKVIVPMARTYSMLVDEAFTGSQHAAAVNRHLKWLNRLEFSDWLAPAIAFAVRHQGDPVAMLGFFKDLERLAYWMLLTRAGVWERLERFARLTKDVETSVDLDQPSSAMQLSGAEREATRAVLDGPVYEVLPARARSTVLLRLDDLLSGGGATYDYPTITVEHVLPQTPVEGGEWMKWFPDEADRTRWVHRLGNLALLTRKKNSAASNYEFERKKETYFAKNGVSPFPLTTQVLKHADWTPAIVSARQQEMLGALTGHWWLAPEPA